MRSQPLHRLLAGVIGVAFLGSIPGATHHVDAQSPDSAPQFDVDPSWPKPLPNNWAVGPVSGIAVDGRDHIWIIHRGEMLKQDGKTPAPPVIEFDQTGAVVQSWGGPGTGYDWPQQVHGITVDGKDRVWMSGKRRSRRPHPCVHTSREISAADRPSRRERRQQ